MEQYMPVKKVSVVFDLDVELFTHMLAHSNSGVRFDVYGDDKVPNKATSSHIEAPKRQLALPPPTKSARHLILAQMKKDPEHTFTTAELVVFAGGFGFGQSSVWNAMHNMHRDGLVRRYTLGKYRVSKKGMQHG